MTPKDRTLLTWIAASAAVIVGCGVVSRKLNLSSPEARRILRLRWKLFRYCLHVKGYRVIVKLRRDSAPWPNYWTYVSLVEGQKPCELGSIETWSCEEAVKMGRSQYLKSLERSAGAHEKQTGAEPGAIGQANLTEPRPQSASDLFAAAKIPHSFKPYTEQGLCGLIRPALCHFTMEMEGMPIVGDRLESLGKTTMEMGTGLTDPDPAAGAEILADWNRFAKGGTDLRFIGMERIPNPVIMNSALDSLAHLIQVEFQPESCYRYLCTCGWRSSTTQAGHMCLPCNCKECGAVRTEWDKHVEEALPR